MFCADLLFKLVGFKLYIMSLSSLLLSAGGKKAIDSELDALFTAKVSIAANLYL